MKKSYLLFMSILPAIMLSGMAALGATVSSEDQQALRTQYAGKVLIFRKPIRMVTTYDVQEDGTLKGDPRPGFWSMDAVVQVKDIEFRKDRVTFKCAKLWADIRNDGHLHFFPASAALKGKFRDYSESADVIFRTGQEPLSAAVFSEKVKKVFLGEQESALSTAPQPIAAYIQNVPAETDVDTAAGKSFNGTLPKLTSKATPSVSKEAELVGLAGKESFVLYVDAQGKAAVVGFTHLLQYGLEETTIDAVKGWTFEPAVQDGKPVAARIPMSIDYKLP